LEKTKPHKIPKSLFVDAYQRIRANGGATGIDGMSLETFERKEKDNLYKLWNRMSSGSYFPKPVKRVEIPKKNGGTRPLGIPTVTDRIAQMVARMIFEPILEPHFHPNSYGYRPGKSAHEALALTRKRCWEYDWVIDLDIKGFFDAIDHELMMKAVKHHNPPQWIIIYIERWLKSEESDEAGNLNSRELGTPQGGVISPLLANLFLHYAFDRWMSQENPENLFERYADDIVIHCRSQKEAEILLKQIRERLNECKLTVHPEKTKIVYCKDENRAGEFAATEFDFLGYTFKSRYAKTRAGKFFNNFTPAISKQAEKKIRDSIRSWRIHRWGHSDIKEISAIFNTRLRGWYNYYGKFRVSALHGIFRMFQNILVKWAKKKYKSLRRSWKLAKAFVLKIAKEQRDLFVHWKRGWCLGG
jgi:RNA-directed DNA polymerase